MVGTVIVVITKCALILILINEIEKEAGMGVGGWERKPRIP